ncbi:MAG: nitrogen regulation protein NR(II) [Gammaproteobacteria bacterium]|nr:MAG: nitrogen regulation protein NR(II) [Gammaproteobacteria bacterium]RLA24020.1 MAG: nitrogen regulation protein NR(II) [Gammaproteobacteria bacterium]
MVKVSSISQYQRILENLSDAVLYFDQSKMLSYINSAGEILLGVSSRQVQGQSVDKIIQCVKGTLVKEIERALESGTSLVERNLELVSTGGQCVTVDCSITPIYEGNNPNAVLLELQQVDRHLQISKESQLILQQSALKILVKGLAHEIKNPLGGLRGAAQLLEQELEDDSLKEYTQIIIEEADRLKNLMDRMLGPNALPKNKKMNIHGVLERVRLVVQAEVSADVHISRDYDPSIPDVYADKDQLIQAFLNIVRNAAQAVGEKGEIKIKTRIDRKITIGSRQNRLVAKIDIIDNGPGVKKEMQEQIFYPMVTGRAEGTGLGLSISQSIINRYDGLIEYTREGGCTLFSVYLPLETGHG